MRWATFRTSESGTDLVGVVVGDEIAVIPGAPSLLGLIQSGEENLRGLSLRAQQSHSGRFALSEVLLRPPIPTPPSIRDFMAFEQHVAAGAKRRGEPVPDQWYKMPTFYFSNPHAVIGPTDDVILPAGCERFDFELEVAVVLGRSATNLKVEEARDTILGFTVMNDWSARDFQMAEATIRGPGPSKSKDGATTLGPMLISADELSENWEGRLPDLEMKVSVNGLEYGRDELTNMYWSFEQLIAHASRDAWVRPGDVLATGTCGYGCLSELHGLNPGQFPWLQPGDVVTVEVSCLGSISNRVVAGAERPSLFGNPDDPKASAKR